MFLRDPLKEKKEKRFSPLDELQQLTSYLPSQTVLQMMPQIQKEKAKRKVAISKAQLSIRQRNKYRPLTNY